MADSDNSPPTAKATAIATATAPQTSNEFRELWRSRERKSKPNPPRKPPVVNQLAGVAPLEKTRAPQATGTRARPRMSEEDKVEKHRMIVRRSYYQKKELKAKLRDEIAALEVQYQRLVDDTRQLQLMDRSHAGPSSDGEESSCMRAHCATCAQVQQLQTQYKVLTVTKETLVRERDALEDTLHSQHVFQDKMDQLVARELARREPATSSSSPSSGFSLSTADDAMITAHTPEFHVSFRPLTEEECFDVIRTSLRDFKSQTSSSSSSSSSPSSTGSSTGSSGYADFHDFGSHAIMGWTRKRTYGNRANNFSLLKSFPTQSARILWDRTWRLYTETTLFEQLYCGAVNMKFRILQRVNANSVLFCRTLKTEKLKSRHVTFFLFARFQVDTKYYILFKSIDNDRIHAVDYPEDAVLGMFSWLCFSDHSGASTSSRTESDSDQTMISRCQVEFGGVLPSVSVADTDFWMLEFVSYMLRLENRAIGPIFQVLQ